MTNTVVGARGPERVLVADMARLGLILGPILVLIGTIFWRFDGLLSSVLAFVLVLGNLALGAMIIDRAAAISPTALTGAVLGGFMIRLLLLTAIVVPLRNVGWFEVVPFAIALLGGHFGLLMWESQRVTANLVAADAAIPAATVAPTTPASGPESSPSTLRTRSESEC